MNKKTIQLGGQEFFVIDLMKPLSLEQEVYPGDPNPKRILFSDIEESGWHHYIHELGDHHFQPHGDAPNHQNPELIDKGFEVFNIDYCFNQAFMIDLSESENAISKNGISFTTEIDLQALSPFEKLFSEKGAVLIRTGYDRWLEQNLPHEPTLLPYFTEEAANYLASFNHLKVVGTDSLTVDPPGLHTAHQALKNKLIVESLVNLHSIPGKHRNAFDLQTSPVVVVGATGGPVTAYAFVKIN